MERQRQRTTTGWSWGWNCGSEAEEKPPEKRTTSTEKYTATREIAPERASQERKKILVADDLVEYRESLGRALSPYYAVDSASNVPEMLRKYHQGNYSLILTDNQMGDGYFNTGLYAIHVIRSYDKSLPIFLMTADLTEAVIKEAEEMGVNEILRKPVNLNDLIDKIKQYIC